MDFGIRVIAPAYSRDPTGGWARRVVPLNAAISNGRMGFRHLFLMKFTMGVLVSEEKETQSLDISEHGIQTYPKSAATS